MATSMLDMIHFFITVLAKRAKLITMHASILLWEKEDIREIKIY